MEANFAYQISVEADPSADDIEHVRNGLIQHNVTRSTIGDGLEIAVFLRDQEGEIRGGFCGWIWGSCLELEYAWVDKRLRGQGYGRKMMEQLAQTACQRGCTTIVTDTYSFQAPNFYLHFGFEQFGQVGGYPDGIRKHFLIKQL